MTLIVLYPCKVMILDYLYFLGQFAEALYIERLGELQDVLDVLDPGLLQLLADVYQLDRATLPQFYLLQRATFVPRVHYFLVIQ